jgi:GNAT superfamily N-acetyltransferase
MSDPIQLHPISRSKADLRRFMRVAHQVYRGDTRWVAPLEEDVLGFLSDANPWHRHAEIDFWVATMGGKDVGRIAAILDRQHNHYQEDSAAFFGYYEALPDPAITRRLIEEVKAWARKRSLRRVLGPMNPTTNNECGLLVEGFHSPPVLMMTYNPPYYVDRLTEAGFVKAKDLLAFEFEVAPAPLARIERAARIFGDQHSDIQVRPVKKGTLEADLKKIKDVYNAAWEKNWGFVPMTDDEIHFMAERLKPLLVEGLVWLAETPEEAVGFLLALPDFNEAIQPLGGHLFSLNLWRAVPYFMGWKRPRYVRVVAFGIKEGYRKRGLEAIMFRESLRFSLRVGFQRCEASWILENNLGVQRVIELFGGRRYKRYRIYELAL